MMKTSCISLLTPAMAVLLFLSCSTPPKAEKEAPPKPENTLQIASLNLADLNKRIVRKNIVELAKILKREEIDVFAVQGISRYPGVATRVDFVDELSVQTDWRNVFGEMENISGRQTGNAIFTSYPIISHHNQTFDKVKSANFEAALQATVDAGAGSLFVISTQLPPKAPPDDQSRCMEIIASLSPSDAKSHIIVAGNLPLLKGINPTGNLVKIPNLEQAKKSTPTLWYSANASFQLLANRVVETELGMLVIAQLGFFRQR